MKKGKTTGGREMSAMHYHSAATADDDDGSLNSEVAFNADDVPVTVGEQRAGSGSVTPVGPAGTRNKYHLKALDHGEIRAPPHVKKMIRKKSRKLLVHDSDSDDEKAKKNKDGKDKEASTAMSKEEQDAVLATPIPDDAKFKVSIVAAGRFWNEESANESNLQDSTLLLSEEEELQLVQAAKMEAEKEKQEQRQRELQMLKKQTEESQKMRMLGSAAAAGGIHAGQISNSSNSKPKNTGGLPEQPTVGDTGTNMAALVGAVASGSCGLVASEPVQQVRSKANKFSPKGPKPGLRRGNTEMTMQSVDNFGEMNIYSPDF